MCTMHVCVVSTTTRTVLKKAGGDFVWEVQYICNWEKIILAHETGENSRKRTHTYMYNTYWNSRSLHLMASSSVAWPVLWAHRRKKNHVFGIMQHSEIIIRGQCNIMFIIWTGKYGKTKCNSSHLVDLIPAPHFWSGFVWGRSLVKQK